MASAPDIRITPAEPSALVVLLHGLTRSAKNMEPLAQKWAAALPRTAFLCLSAPQYPPNGGDWFKYPKQRAEFDSDEQHVAMILDCVRDRMAKLDAAIDTELVKSNLTNKQLVVVGFSQGAALAAYTGLARRCVGVVPLGGPCPPREQLLPDHQDTRVCVVTGDRDPYAPHELIKSAFAKYAPQGETDGVHVVPGLTHIISEQSESLGLAFLRACGCK